MDCEYIYKGRSYSEEEFKNLLNKDIFASQGFIGSRASENTLKKVKEVLNKMGVDIKDLAQYAKTENIDITGMIGLADLTKGVIAVSQGREDVVLTEEMVHIATQIVEQTNKPLITALISKIDKFDIYKQTLNQYKNNKYYQLPDGKPDIRKIKKEAVDKLISEVIINKTEQKDKSLIHQWWDAILDFINSLYKRADIQLFKEVADKILNEDIGTVEGLKGEVFLKIEENKAVNDLYNTFIDRDKRLNLIPSSEKEKRHYTFDTQKVTKTISEKAKESHKLPERSETDKQLDEVKREFGDRGHIFIKNYIEQNWIDENGFKLEKSKDIPIFTNLPDSLKNKVKSFADELMSSYPMGTRFLIEKKAINEKVKGLLASTMDFVAIIPQKDDKIKVDILDWKFTSVNKDRAKDIPWFKQSEWNEQMKEYTHILYNYGLNPKDLGKARMIPFIINWKHKKQGDKTSPLLPTSFEVGDINNPKETQLYLLPVPVESESTGNPEVDKLLKSLDEYYEKLYKTPVSEKERPIKMQNLEELSKAIRKLHIQLDFEPLRDVASGFMQNAFKSLASFSDLDFDKLSQQDINNKLAELLQFEGSALKFSSIDDIFLSQFSKEGLNDDQKKTLLKLEQIAGSTRRMLDRILELKKEYTVWIALKTGITQEESKETVLDPEKEIGFFSRTFMEPSKLSSKIINVASNLIQTTKNLVDIRFNKVFDEFGKLLVALEKEIPAGKTAFDMIGKVHNGELKLLYKLDKEFLDKIKEAKETKDKKFLLSVMDKEKFDKLKDDYIKEQEILLKERYYSDDQLENASKAKYNISKMKDSVDIDRKTFNGYYDYHFNVLFRKTLIEEGHYSEDFKQMSQSKAASEMWNFFISLNEKGNQSGYLQGKGLSFFPLMEATIAEKIGKTQNLSSEITDIYKDLYTIRAEEEQGYSKIDEETGKVKIEVPKLFTRTKKAVHQLSTDLNKVGALWIKALLEYEANKEIENTLLILHSVEKNKHSLLLNSKQEIIMEGGEPKVNEESNKNADILWNIVLDGIYGIKENLDSIGNIGLATAAKSVTKDKETQEETVLSTKKLLRNGNRLTESLAVGWKLLVTIPNNIGYHTQSFINSGNLYKSGEFEKNNTMVTSTIGFNNSKKGLLDLFIPLNDSAVLEKRRELAWKQSPLKWLSTWTFHDVMMATNSFPEKLLQYANALSILDNTMVVNDKLLNIRQYLKSKDRKEKYKLSESDRKNLEKTFENRVTELKESSSLEKIAKIENDKLVIPGVSDEEIAKYRVKIIEYNRNLSGQMSENNKADYRRDTILKSFMMFRNWIPKQVTVRALGIKKNIEIGEWEYGRTRAFLSTAVFLGLRNITDMNDIIKGTDKGLSILNQMLKDKKEAYFIKTGQQLEITEEEFYDLMRTVLRNQMKELIMLTSLIAMVGAVYLAKPDDDEENKYAINRWKFWMKAAHKAADELFFYYNPLSFESMTRGSIVPSLGLLTKTQKFFTSFGKEMYGEITNDQEIIDKSYPLKYFLDIIPGASQFDKEILPLIDPEMAKSMGIKTTSEARIRQ